MRHGAWFGPVLISAILLTPRIAAAESAFVSSKMLAAEDDLDLQAQKMMSDPAVQQARKRGEQSLIAIVPNPTAETRNRLREAVDEITFFGALNGLNDDPLHPRITFVGRPGRTVNGTFTLAPKGIDENPDSVYRVIPVDGASTYLIHGKASSPHPSVNDFSVLDEDWKTVGNLDGAALKLEADGAFTITVSPDPANGRPNYIQTRSGANYMTIRDTILDWAHEKPNRLTVERVGPTAPPLSKDDQMKKVITKIDRYFLESVKLQKRILALPVNTFPQPAIAATGGQLVSQAYAPGQFKLEKGQALVLTIQPGTAKYVTVPLTNLWGVTMDPVHHASSLNLDQVVRDADGSFTVVASPVDPGVENWVDTEGLYDGFLFLRWAAMTQGKPDDPKPSVEAKVVPLDALPETLAKVDPDVRRLLTAKRAADYDLRWTEN
jgi:hypothetical protein